MSKETIKVIVELSVDTESGDINTSHYMLTEADHDKLSALPANGLPQLSQSLMLESFKREAYVSMVTLLSQGKEITEIDPNDIKTLARSTFDRALDKYLGAVCGMVLLPHVEDAETPQDEDSAPSGETDSGVDEITFD